MGALAGSIPDSAWSRLDALAWSTILTVAFGTVKRIPYAQTLEFRRALSLVAGRLRSQQSPASKLQAWKAFVFLPFLLLQPTKERGKQGTLIWKTRFQRFWAGEWDTLAQEAAATAAARPRRGRQSAAAAQQHLFAQVEQLITQGQLSKACSLLESPGVAPATADSLKEMERLHPAASTPYTPQQPSSSQQQPGPSSGPSQPDSDMPTLSAQELKAALIIALRRAKKGSAGGLTGWRYEHIKACVLSRQGDADIVECAPIIDALLVGDVPDPVRKVLGAGNLTGLRKDVVLGGVRPLVWGTRGGGG